MRLKYQLASRKKLSTTENFTVRKANVFDVEGMLALINSCAVTNLVLPRGPKYLYENIRDFIVVELQTEAEQPRIVACGSLHVLWKDTAEIRSLVTHPEFRRRGLATKIVQHLVEEAVQLGIERIIALTLIEEFFKTLGFKPKKKEELPSKIWDECSRCPKYFQCDEVGLVLECPSQLKAQTRFQDKEFPPIDSEKPPSSHLFKAETPPSGELNRRHSPE